MSDTPSMPQTQAEWDAHWAFYELTVAQRNAAWMECAELRSVLEMVQDHVRDTKEEVEGYVWCDKECCVHDDCLNPYGYTQDPETVEQSWCKPEHHRKLYMPKEAP